jgi:uncharacterized RDD family membrane protein YckC
MRDEARLTKDGAAAARQATKIVRAPFSLRCGALLVDYTAVVAVVAFSTILARVLDDGARWAGKTALTLGYLSALALAVLNFVVLASVAGRTFGKWVTGLRIERLDGTPISFARACLRHFVGYVLTLLTFGLGFLFAAFNLQGRALHDYVAGTIVVRDRGRAGAAARRAARHTR